MASDEVLKTVIIGSGPAGITAAIYAARANLRPVLLAGATPGGLLTKTSEVENFPGFRKGINGPQLMDEMLAQVEYCGGRIIYESCEELSLKARPFTITYGGGEKLAAHTLIFATGASPRWLGLPGETQFAPPKGAGVSSCAVCDGSFYRGKPVAVVGGGDSAMEEATYLSKLCSSVTVVHRREGFRASKVMVARARSNPVIRWELNRVVTEILGDLHRKPLPVVTGLRLKHVASGATNEIQVAALFVAIGHVPTTGILRGQVELDEQGFVKVTDRQETSLSGFFAAGDCHDRRYRQAVTAAGMGCKAALEAERYLTLNGLA